MCVLEWHWLSWLKVIRLIVQQSVQPERKQKNTVKREVIFNCFVLFCTSLHTYMYSAMTASISCLNVTEMTIIWHVISHNVILLRGKISTVESCGIWLRHFMGIYFISHTLWLLSIILSLSINFIFVLYMM